MADLTIALSAMLLRKTTDMLAGGFPDTDRLLIVRSDGFRRVALMAARFFSRSAERASPVIPVSSMCLARLVEHTAEREAQVHQPSLS